MLLALALAVAMAAGSILIELTAVFAGRLYALAAVVLGLSSVL